MIVGGVILVGRTPPSSQPEAEVRS